MAWSDDDIAGMRRKVEAMREKAETDVGVRITLASIERRLARMVQERALDLRRRSSLDY